jgi:RNA polymerase sigma factor (sigma-70 family)
MTQTKQKNWDASAFTPGIKFKPNAKKDNPTTVEEAFKQCTPMIHKLAKRWTRNHYQYYNDFVSEGHLGVAVAWERFNGTDFQKKGYRFSSYAFMWIRACMKDFANRLWKNFNNTTEGTDYNMDTDYYEVSTDAISVKRNYEKLSERDQQVIRLKTEGYSFEEVASQLGFQNLHKCRAHYIQLCEQLAE